MARTKLTQKAPKRNMLFPSASEKTKKSTNSSDEKKGSKNFMEGEGHRLGTSLSGGANKEVVENSTKTSKPKKGESVKKDERKGKGKENEKGKKEKATTKTPPKTKSSIQEKIKEIDNINDKKSKRKMKEDVQENESEEEDDEDTIGIIDGSDDEVDEDEISLIKELEGVGSSDEGDEDEGSDEEDGEALAKKLPKVPAEKLPKKAPKKSPKEKAPVAGVVYLGRLPRGFEEPALRAYFSQFGEVTKLRVSRNKKTGKSKHYAFIEFQHKEVAEIVAETMHNYLLSGHILQCQVIPPEKCHKKLWIGANKKYRAPPKSRQSSRLSHNAAASKTGKARSTIQNRLLKRQDAKKEKLKDLGIEYEFDGYEQAPEEDKKTKKADTKSNAKSKKVETPKDEKEKTTKPAKAAATPSKSPKAATPKEKGTSTNEKSVTKSPSAAKKESTPSKSKSKNETTPNKIDKSKAPTKTDSSSKKKRESTAPVEKPQQKRNKSS